MTNKERELLELTLHIEKLNSAVFKLNANAIWIDQKLEKLNLDIPFKHNNRKVGFFKNNNSKDIKDG